MTTVSAVRRRGRRVSVEFDAGPPLECDRDFLPVHRLAAGQAIEPAILERVREQAARHSAEVRALRYLAPRPRGRREMERHLRAHDVPEPVIADTIAMLHQRGYMDDRAYAEAWRDQRARRRPSSARQIQSELRARGVDPAIAAEVTANLDDEQVAHAVAMKQVQRFRGDWTAFQRRAGAVLLRRGFSTSLANAALRAAWRAAERGPGDETGDPADMA